MHVTFDPPVTPGQSESGPYSCFILAQAFHKAAQCSGLIALEPFGKLIGRRSRKRLTNSRACWATLAIAGESCSRAFTKAFCLPSRAAGSCNSHQVAVSPSIDVCATSNRQVQFKVPITNFN